MYIAPLFKGMTNCANGSSFSSKRTLLDLLKDGRRRSGDQLVAFDMRMALFASSQASYRRDSVLKPFPPAFTNNNQEKLFTEIVSPSFSVSSLRVMALT